MALVEALVETVDAASSLEDQESKAKLENDRLEARLKAARKKRNKKPETKAEREAKAQELHKLLEQSAAFSSILTGKTQALGRVGTGLDGTTLGEHDLKMAEQPKCLVGGTMRDYQLEGLTWMYEICLQGMSGILADEMGLGKTVQTISLIALLREQEGYLGPHLIIAPLSTLSNWIDEFERWVPSIPVTLYHGDPTTREDLRKRRINAHISKDGRPTNKFPVVCTSYEIILRDKAHLSKINWEFIIIDEGHRMKNFDSKLFRELKQFRSATRLLITGTPLQNNLRELWSLLNFLLPEIFVNWDAFETWFDFSDLQDEEGTQEFLADRMKHDLVKKIHLILQPLLLRRVKADVASYLPKKREYVLYAPMTKEQTDLYNAINGHDVDVRAFLEAKVVDHLTAAAEKEKEDTPDLDTDSEPDSKPDPKQGRLAKSQANGTAKVAADPEPDTEQAGLTEGQTKGKAKAAAPPPPTPKAAATLPVRGGPAKPMAKNAFAMMMGKNSAQTPPKQPPRSTPSLDPAAASGSKRKGHPTADDSDTKSSKSSRHSTPSTTSRRGRLRKGRQSLADADSDDDLLDDDDFEEKLAAIAADEDAHVKAEELAEGELERSRIQEQAKKEVGNKKLGNPLMQLRLVCNSPHNFYNPFHSTPVTEAIVTSSGKMLLLDRLLPELFSRGHKVLIFSQFQTQLDILEDYCSHLRGWDVCRIDGSVNQESRRDQIAAFNKDPSLRVFLLSTRAGGQGINLASADTVILFDSDWNPQQDLQAQDRCHRIGQTRPVVVYRLATKGTVEESLLMSADAKRRLEKLVIKKGGFRTMGQKLHANDEDDEGALQDMDPDALKQLLLKDGEVYEWKGKGSDEILSREDLVVLCDRSDEAYERAAGGEGDAEGWKVVETGADGIVGAGKEK